MRARLTQTLALTLTLTLTLALSLTLTLTRTLPLARYVAADGYTYLDIVEQKGTLFIS